MIEIVLEGEAANDVYALLCRAKEECASEERDHCSEVIHTVKGDFCFALGLENIYEDTGDDYWGPAVKETVLREDVFMLFAYPFDSSSRHILDVGRIEYQYDGTVLRINEELRRKVFQSGRLRVLGKLPDAPFLHSRSLRNSLKVWPL